MFKVNELYQYHKLQYIALSTIMKKILKHPKYLYFVSKNELF